MNKKEEPKKCCSNLNCTETVELRKAVALELELEDKPIKELINASKKADDND